MKQTEYCITSTSARLQRLSSPPLHSIHAPGSDPMLSFISSYLDSHPRSAAQHSSAPSQPEAALAPSGNNSGGSAETRGSGPLDLWEVQWPELTILRLVGHGSFGAVYLAEWKQIQVAVKVLVAKGGWSIWVAFGVAVTWCWEQRNRFPINRCCSAWACRAGLLALTLPLPFISVLRGCQLFAENMHRGQLELPDKVVHQLQAEAAVMSRMRHPK